MTRNSKSQIAGQVFVYILSLIIISLVLLYGYKAIKDFWVKQEEVRLINFKNSLEKVLVRPMRHGDVKPFDIPLPGKYEKLCFVDTYNTLSEIDKGTKCLCISGCADADALICDAWKTTNISNAYLYPMSNIPINLGPITVDGNGDGKEDMPATCGDINCSYLCITSERGNVQILMHGMGNHVFIQSR